MIIAKIRKPFLIDLSWQPYTGWLWVTTASISASYSPPSAYDTLGYTFDSYNTDETEIGQVYVDNVEYTIAASLAECILTDMSWFFDTGEQQLYVHVDHTKRMDASDFDSLQIRGYSNKYVFKDDNGFVFLPYLTSTPSISDEVDRIVFSKMSFTSNSLSFKNHTGEFDYAFTEKVPGADVNIYYLSDDDYRAGKKTLTALYTGYVDGENATSSAYTISVADKREQLNGKIPSTYYTEADFPDIEDDMIDELISEGYGVFTNLPAYCTNGTATTGDVTYKYATDGTVLTAVYIYNDDEEWEEVTPTESDAEACTFSLSDTVGRDANDDYYETKVDCTLREETTPGLIMIDMFQRYNSVAYTSDNYDFYEWSTESALLSDVNLLLDSRQKFFEWIELLQNGSTLPFIFRANPSGKYTMKVDKITRAVENEYTYLENINDDRDVETDFTQYATSVIINYGYNPTTEEYQSVTLDTYYDETYSTYRVDNELEYDTLNTTLADATTRGDAILKDYKDARGLHTVTLRGIIVAPLLDVIKYDSSIYVNGVMTREYAGDVKLKIASYEYDFENNATILTGYDISDIISEGTETYSQGFMHGTRACGHRMCGPTVNYTPEAG